MNLNYVCLSCWITTDEGCADITQTAQNRAICPRWRLIKANLPAEQMAELTEISRLRKYPLRHFVRMAELQAEWNRIPVGGLNV